MARKSKTNVAEKTAAEYLELELRRADSVPVSEVLDDLRAELRRAEERLAKEREYFLKRFETQALDACNRYGDVITREVERDIMKAFIEKVDALEAASNANRYTLLNAVTELVKELENRVFSDFSDSCSSSPFWNAGKQVWTAAIIRWVRWESGTLKAMIAGQLREAQG